MSSFTLQMFHIMLLKVCNAICLDFSLDFQIPFLPGQFKKNHEKTFLKKQQQFSVKIFSQFLAYVDFFSRFSKVVLLICGNITMLYITKVPEM